MFDLLIDSTGKPWPAEGRRIRRRLGIVSAESDIVAQAVGRLGFIYLRPIGSALIVVFRPEQVGWAALIGLFDAMIGIQPQRILVSYRTGLGGREWFLDIYAAMARIEELASGGRSAAIRPFYEAQRRPLDLVVGAARGRLREALQIWSDAGGRWSPEFCGQLKAMRLLDEAVLIEQDGGGDPFRIVNWGRTLDIFGPSWSRVAPGRALHSLPSPELGRRLADSYRETAAGGVPQFDEVEFVAERPGGRIARSRQDRLLLPWFGKAGQTVVSVLTPVRWKQWLN